MIKPDDAAVLELLGAAYDALENRDKAAACFIRAGELKEKNGQDA